MKLVVNEEECLLTVDQLNIILGMNINLDDDYMSQNNLISIYGNKSNGHLVFSNQPIAVFGYEFSVSIIIRNNIVSVIGLTLKTDSLTKGNGIYDEELCLLEIKQLIEIVTSGISRTYDDSSMVGHSRAIWHTNWGEINVSYEIQTPSVGIYLS